jgi:hypothetical protein
MSPSFPRDAVPQFRIGPLRTEVAVGGKGPDAQLDQWAVTIRYEDEADDTGRDRIRRIPSPFRRGPTNKAE